MPASLSRSLTEIHQEGLRFPPMKLVREGVFDEQIMKIMSTNVRKPALNTGDIKALVGALGTGERKVHAMIDRFGHRGFLSGVAALMEPGPRRRPGRSSLRSPMANTSSPITPTRTATRQTPAASS